MGKFIGNERAEEISSIMFKSFTDKDADRFLKQELERYVPEFTKATDEEIANFSEYQRSIYIDGHLPEIGTPIASPNPTFIDSLDNIVLADEIYTRASTKENGYRFQLHRGTDKNISAFTRQFTRYDLRMMPELQKTIMSLPIMIGDTELVNAKHKHLAGFNRVNARIPNQTYWPRKGEAGIDDALLEKYLDSELFIDGMPTDEYRMTLAFHGLFAIAHPDTWGASEEEQLKNMISFCKLPMDYRMVDKALDRLNDYIQDIRLDARVVERKVIKSEKMLETYVNRHERQNYEGVCVVQHAKDDFSFAKSFKIKKYETFDTVLMGLYLNEKSMGMIDDNIKGALLGLYDEELGQYLPALKVNLDPDGVQIKTDGQRERLTELRREIALADLVEGESVPALYDVYLAKGAGILSDALPEDISGKAVEMLDNLPRGKDFIKIYELYSDKMEEYEGGLGSKKSSTKTDKCIHHNLDVLSAVSGLGKVQKKKVLSYFEKAVEVKKVSKKFLKPQVVVDISEPMIMETKVFDLKLGLNQYSAGFDLRYCDSFKFNNAFAEIIRHDKATTTDYGTVRRIAKKNTVKRGDCIFSS